MLSVVFYQMDLPPLRLSPPPPFIDTRRGGVHAQEIVEVVVFSPNRGVQWSSTVEGILRGMASDVAVVPGVVLALAEIAPASL